MITHRAAARRGAAPAVASGLLLLGACVAAAPVTDAGGPETGAPLVEAGRDWLEVRFPPAPLDSVGCDRVLTTPDGRRRRLFQWHVAARFPDSRHPQNHFAAVYVDFLLPVAAELTAARLDSALAAQRPVVDEMRGEPPMPRDSTVPARAWVRREGDRVRLRMEGAQAVGAFMRTGADSADVGWCRLGEPERTARVPIRRR